MSLLELMDREERPAYVRFECRPMEDKQASVREGRYVAKNVDFALVTPPYSKDCIEYKAEQWLISIEKNAREGRIPEKWVEQWKAAYKSWKNGQEMPLNGTPIKGWGVISPAQQQVMISINCLTVEDLAAINDEGLHRIGMGAVELRDKARNWLASMKDHGAVTVQLAAMAQENRNLLATVESLKAQVDALKNMIPRSPEVIMESGHDNAISAADLLEEEPEEEPEEEQEEEPKRRGRPQKSNRSMI